MTEIDSLSVRVGADTRGLRDLGTAEQRIDQFTARADRSLSRLDGAFDRMNVAALRSRDVLLGIIGLQFGADLAGEFTTAADSAMRFQTAMAQVSTLLDGNSGLDRYTAQVKAMAREFGTMPVDQAKGLYEIIAAGSYSAANAVEVLDAANRLAIGGVTGVQTAADGLTSVLNAYGAAAGSAASVSDAFFAAAAAGKTNIQELAAYIGQVSPIAAQVGVSLDELMAAAAALTAGGIKTSTAMDGLRSVIAAVLKPSMEAAETANALGLQFNEAALKSKGLAGFLADVAAKAGGNTEALARLFGGVEALLPVMALGSTNTTAFADALTALRDKAGATAAAYEKIAETAQKSADRVKAAAELYRIELGDRLLVAIQPATRALADNFEAVTSSVETAAAVLAATFAARGVAAAVRATAEFGAAQVAMRRELAGTTGHLFAKEAAMRSGAAAAVAASLADDQAARGSLASAQASLAAAQARQTDAIAALRNTAGKAGQLAAQTRLEASTVALTRAETVLAAAQTRVAETGGAVTMAQGAQASALQRTGVAATLASRALGGLNAATSIVGGPLNAALMLGAGAVAFFAMQSSEAEAATEAFADAQGATRAALKDSATDVNELARQYAGLSDNMKAVTRLKLDEALKKQQDAILAQRRAAISAVYSPTASPYRIVEGTHGDDTAVEVRAFERMGLAADQVDRLRVAFQAFQTAAQDDPQAMLELVQVLEGIGRKAGEAGKPLLDLAQKLKDPATRADAAAKEAAKLAAQLVLLEDPANEAARAILSIGQAGTTAAGGIANISSAATTAAGAIDSLRRQTGLLSIPKGFERDFAKLLDQETDGGKKPITGERANELRDELAGNRQAETRDQTADLERQALGNRLLAGAVTDAARAHAQNRIELAKVAATYPDVDAATVRALLTTKDFEGTLKALGDSDLTKRWAALQASSQAQLAGATAQATAQMSLQVAAANRLADAAGRGEAAQRAAAAENEIAAASLRGLSEATVRANEAAKETATRSRIHAEFVGQIDLEVAAGNRLAEALTKGAAAGREAELQNAAIAQTLKEIPYPKAGEDTAAWNKALAENIDKLREQQASADGLDLSRYQQQLDETTRKLQQERRLSGLSESDAAAVRARQDVLDNLRKRGRAYEDLNEQERRTVDGQITQAEQNAALELGIRRQRDAMDALGDAVDDGVVRPLESAVDAIVKGQGESLKWGNVLKGMAASLLGSFIQMAAINPFKNAMGLGSYSPTLWDAAGGGAGGSGGDGGMMGSLTNWGMNKAVGYGAEKMGLSPGSMIDNFGTNYLGIAPTAAQSIVPAVGGQAATTAATTINPATGSLAAYNSWGAAGAQGAASSAGGIAGSGVGLAGAAGGVVGAAGAGYMVGGYLGTKTQSKGVGALGGAAAGAAYGTMIMPGWGTAIGAVIGAIAGAVGTTKISNREGNATLDVQSGAITVGGQEGKKFSQENRDAAKALMTSVAALAGGLESILPGQQIDASRAFIAVGDRDATRVQYGDQSAEFGKKGDTAGVFDWFAKQLVTDMRDSMEAEGVTSQVADNVLMVLDRGIGGSVEQFLSDLTFAASDFASAFDSVGKVGADEFSLQIAAMSEQFQAADARAEALGLATKGYAESLEAATERLYTAAYRARSGLGGVNDVLAAMESWRVSADALTAAGINAQPAMDRLGQDLRDIAISFGDSIDGMQRLTEAARILREMGQTTGAVWMETRAEQVRAVLTQGLDMRQMAAQVALGTLSQDAYDMRTLEIQQMAELAFVTDEAYRADLMRTHALEKQALAAKQSAAATAALAAAQERTVSAAGDIVSDLDRERASGSTGLSAEERIEAVDSMLRRDLALSRHTDPAVAEAALRRLTATKQTAKDTYNAIYGEASEETAAMLRAYEEQARDLPAVRTWEQKVLDALVSLPSQITATIDLKGRILEIYEPAVLQRIDPALRPIIEKLATLAEQGFEFTALPANAQRTIAEVLSRLQSGASVVALDFSRVPADVRRELSEVLGRYASDLKVDEFEWSMLPPDARRLVAEVMGRYRNDVRVDQLDFAEVPPDTQRAIAELLSRTLNGEQVAAWTPITLPGNASRSVTETITKAVETTETVQISRSIDDKLSGILTSINAGIGNNLAQLNAIGGLLWAGNADRQKVVWNSAATAERLGGVGVRAAGGPVQAGRSYIVGERGPEKVTFGADGWVFPHGMEPPALPTLTLPNLRLPGTDSAGLGDLMSLIGELLETMEGKMDSLLAERKKATRLVAEVGSALRTATERVETATRTAGRVRVTR
ncbi:phage tail tape measure protein [Azospirillum argentinense]